MTISEAKDEGNIEKQVEDDLLNDQLNKSEEMLVSSKRQENLDVFEMEKICSFEDDEFDFLTLNERVGRLTELREWFYEEYGDTAAEKSGFVHALSVESRLLTFLIARNFDVAAASTMVEKHVSWLAKYDIYSIDVNVHCPNAFKSGCWRVAGADNEGTPIIWIQAKLWKPREYYSVDEYIYYIGWMVENTRRISMNKTAKREEKVNMLYDMEGFSMFTCDMRCIKNLITVLQDHFPESLKRAFVVNTNLAFQAMMKLVQYLLSKRTTRKMFILGSDESMKKTLLSCIPSEVLPTKYGGTCEIEYPIGSDQYIKQLH